MEFSRLYTSAPDPVEYPSPSSSPKARRDPRPWDGGLRSPTSAPDERSQFSAGPRAAPYPPQVVLVGSPPPGTPPSLSPVPSPSPGDRVGSAGPRQEASLPQRPPSASPFGLNPSARYALSVEDVALPEPQAQPRYVLPAPKQMSMPFWKRLLTDPGFRRGIQRAAAARTLAFHTRTQQSDAFRWGLCLDRMAASRRPDRHAELQQALRAYLETHSEVGGAAAGEDGADEYWRRSGPKSTVAGPERWRVALQNSRALTELAQEWWRTVPKTAGLLTKRTYIMLNTAIEGSLYAATNTPVPQDPVAVTVGERTALEAFVENDWHTDCGGKRRLDQAAFQRWLFSLLDLWTETYDVDEYVDLLQCLARRLFDETGGLLEPVEAPEVHVTPVARGSRTQQRADRLLSAEEKRFLQDEPLEVPKPYVLDSLLAELAAALTPPSADSSPKSSAPGSTLARDPAASSETDLIRDTSLVDSLVAAIHALPPPKAPAANPHGQAVRERNAIAELAPPGARLVTLYDYNRRLYGTQPRQEGFTLEKVCMGRMTTKLGHSAATPDAALLAYLRDHTIDQADLQRIVESDPALFDRFLAALSAARQHGAAAADPTALPPDVAGPVDPVDETLRWLRASREPLPEILVAAVPPQRPHTSKPRALSHDPASLVPPLQVTSSRHRSLPGDKGLAYVSQRPLGGRPCSPWRASQSLRRSPRPLTAPARAPPALVPLPGLQLAPVKMSPR
eukprot:EG_transcript_3629